MRLKNAIVRAVIEDGKCHERKQEVHADGLGDFEESVGGLASRHYLVKQEEHVTTIKRRDGEDVHKGKHEGDKSSEFPEALPIPSSREE